MKILLTGGCGYVGSMLVPALLADGHRVTVFDIMWFGNYLAPHPDLKVVQGDIREIDSVPMDGIEAVMHLANVANDPCADLDAKISWEVNVLASMFLAESAIAHGVGQFIFASSGSVYGVKSEQQVIEELSLVPISDYNKTKMISERVLLSYKDKIIVQCVRPATVCGYSPRMRLDLSVNMLAIQALAKKRITVFGGEQQRPNIHILDMVGVYQHLLKLGPKAAGVFNAGFENMSIMDIARLVTSHIPAEIKITGTNDPRSYRLNSDKLLATGFRPRHGVEDAVREIKKAYEDGKLQDKDEYYNIRMMQKKGAR